MSRGLRFFKAVSVVAAALVFMVAASTFNAAAQRPQRTIVIVEDEGSEDTLTLALKREIGAIVADTNEARIRSVPIPAGATDAQIDDILQRIYAAPDTSVVVIADISLNQSFARKTRFAKPTLLPFVFDAGFSGLKKVGETSGTKNLTYTAPDFEFIEEFETFASVAPIKNAVLLSSDRVVRAISESTKTKARAAAKSLGFSIEIVAYDTAAGALSKPLARDVDTVFVGVLPEVSNAQIRALLSQLTAQGIATYALASEQFVELGALATNAPSADTTRLARRAAINVAELLAGVPAQSLPVSMNLNDQLTINMATARALKVAPPFDVLLSARLLNDIDESAGPVYSLTQVARQAVSANLALMAQRFQAQQAQARISETRGALLPQVSAGLSYLQRRQTNNVQAGFAPQSTTDGSITLSQSIFTEEFWAAYAIEKYSALSEKALLREVELDIIQAAVETYLAILREKTSLEQAVFNLDITRENQRLARNRVDVGTEDASDLFRWQSELATAKQTVLAANAGYEQLRQQLNQILNRPINEPFSVTIETLENPDLLIVDERITSLISNAYDLEVLSDYFVEVGLERSPEIDQAEVAIKSNARQLKSNKRQFWLPDISLVGQYSNNLDEDRVLSMVGLPAQDDWSVTVQASIDLFEGGARFSRVEQSRLAVRQSQTSLRNIENQVEQDIRNALEVMTASFTSIPLARDAEVAAQKNYDLVAEAYAQGKRDIINVLDAQDALVDAREAALNAVYNFLINLMTTQRAIGGFDFFLDDREKLAFNNELIRRVQANQMKTKGAGNGN